MACESALEQLTKDELYDLARDRDISGRTNMDKEELIAALADGGEAQRMVTAMSIAPEPPTGRSGKDLSRSDS